MTTVAYRDGVLAGDTRVTTGDRINTEKQRKVWKLKDGFLFGAAGGIEDIERLKIAIKMGNEPPALTDISAILISPQSQIFLYEGHTWVKQPDKYYAVGTGHDLAMTAMDCGADAVTAVRMGIKRDTKSGGRVLSVRLDKAK